MNDKCNSGNKWRSFFACALLLIFFPSTRSALASEEEELLYVSVCSVNFSGVCQVSLESDVTFSKKKFFFLSIVSFVVPLEVSVISVV